MTMSVLRSIFLFFAVLFIFAACDAIKGGGSAELEKKIDSLTAEQKETSKALKMLAVQVEELTEELEDEDEDDEDEDDDEDEEDEAPARKPTRSAPIRRSRTRTR